MILNSTNQEHNTIAYKISERGVMSLQHVGLENSEWITESSKKNTYSAQLLKPAITP